MPVEPRPIWPLFAQASVSAFTEAIAVRSFGAALAASLAGALVTLSLYRVAWKHAGKGMPARTTLLALVLAVLGLLGTPVVWSCSGADLRSRVTRHPTSPASFAFASKNISFAVSPAPRPSREGAA